MGDMHHRHNGDMHIGQKKKKKKKKELDPEVIDAAAWTTW